MRTYTKKELAEVLEKHRRWLANEDGGECADLHDADLRNADLSDADLSHADMSHADLHDACLCGADLHNADLNGADLCGACLSDADLSHADLSDADLCGADLRGADLRDADLCNADMYGVDMRGVKNVVHPMACPEKGSFIGWKKCRGDLIVELEICADAKRSSATGRKCRCDKAKVLSIVSPAGSSAKKAVSKFDADFVYRVGETVSVDDFDDNRWNECAPGIHFFITRQEAVDY